MSPAVVVVAVVVVAVVIVAVVVVLPPRSCIFIIIGFKHLRVFAAAICISYYRELSSNCAAILRQQLQLRLQLQLQLRLRLLCDNV